MGKSVLPTSTKGRDNVYRQVEVETINIFDSFKEFVVEQLFELETRNMIPALLIAEARVCDNEVPHALLALMNMYKTIDEDQKAQIKNIIFAKRKNPFVLNIASKLASKNKDYLELAEDAYDSVPEIEADIIADFGYAFYQADDYSKAIRFYVKALEVIPDNAEWLHVLAHSYEGMNELDSALAQMERAVSLVKNRYLDCLAYIYSNVDRDEDAFKCYKKALANNPLNARAWNNIGVIYGKRKDYDKERECYEKALKIKPDFIWSLMSLAEHYWQCEDFHKTVEYSLKVLAIDDKYPRCWSLLGRAQFQLGNHTDAKDALEKTIELNQATCIDFEFLGDIHERLNNVEKQIFYYNKAKESHPEHVFARERLDLKQKVMNNSLTADEKQDLDSISLNLLAYDLILTDRFKEAAELLEIGLKKEPDFSYLYATKGMNYLRQGQVQFGHELYLQAISMSPDDVNLKQKFHYEYGRALRIDGQFDKALQELESALHSESKYVPHADIKVEIVKAQERNSTV